MFFKVIIQGKLYFLNRNSYDKLVKVIVNKNTVYYKNEIIHKELEFLDDENFMISVPRLVGNYTDKIWKNTASLFESCAQFAVSGRILMWKVENGKVLDYREIEPSGDRTAIMSYKRGKKYLSEKKEKDALNAFNKSLDKYDKNAMAYERRAVVNLMMKNYVEAKEDFQKCINIDQSVSEAHLGLAKLLKYDGEIELALTHLDFAQRTSVALQPIHWQSRRTKADIYIIQEEWDKAEFELKLLISRNFEPNNPNFKWKKDDLFNYGIVKYNMYDFKEALELFEKSMKINGGKEEIPQKDRYFYLGMAKKNSGKSGYIHDLKKSAELGNKDAEYMLESIL